MHIVIEIGLITPILDIPGPTIYLFGRSSSFLENKETVICLMFLIRSRSTSYCLCHFVCDNQVVCDIVYNPIFHEQTKHVETDCYFIQEMVDSQEIRTRQINIEDQLEDLFTKGLGEKRMHHLLDKLGILNLYAPLGVGWGGVGRDFHSQSS